MKKLIILAFAFCLVGSYHRLSAQEATVTVLYTSSVRGVTFSEEGGNEKRVFAGLTLPQEGQLRLTRGNTARLLYRNQTITLEGPALYTMTELRQRTKEATSEGFLSRFWSFVSNSIKDTDNAEQVERYHRRYLTNARAGISGFVGRESAISAPRYLTQAMDSPHLTFKWDSVAHPHGYHFTITKETAAEPVFSAVTKASELSLDLSELLLEPSAIYVWKVSARQADRSALESSMYYFSYEPDAEEYVAEIKEDDDFKQLSSQERQLYLLYRLEEGGLLHRAYRQYQELSADSSREAYLYRKLFVSFLARMDALEEAKSLVQ
ncbi:MAG: hypothetical protein GVY26_16670 [Bacteroidetes bacterium]|jgi:hypothetical protein|nr:hypothetical protein [Bacteroidota bacterium]